MSGFDTATTDYLTRSNIWSSQLKDILEDELQATKYVKMLDEFPDGNTINIPSIGQFTTNDAVEDESVKYQALDTGNFQFSITENIEVSTYITDEQKEDMFYMNQLVSSFLPKQERTIMTRFETDVMALANEQTASDANTINGGNHRFVASGTGETMGVNDFAQAKFALKKANVPMTDLVAIVDPSVEYTLGTLPNISNVSSNPMWEGIVSSGIATGMKFVKNIHGFDVYTSNYLADANETIGTGTTSAGKANMFFSATADVLPFIGAWRRPPRVEGDRNKDFRRDEYVMTARYGVKLYRPENLVVCLADTDQVN